MRFFIASNTANHGRVIMLAKIMEKLGHINTMPVSTESIRESEGALSQASYSEVQAIRDTEFFLLMLPGSREAQTELGIALSSRYGKRIIIWSETGNEFAVDDACIYYYHPSIMRMVFSFSELIQFIKNL
ncbi:MAG: hypothetical protein RRY79_05540 [Clostridia bacterium]